MVTFFVCLVAFLNAALLMVICMASKRTAPAPAPEPTPMPSWYTQRFEACALQQLREQVQAQAAQEEPTCGLCGQPISKCLEGPCPWGSTETPIYDEQCGGWYAAPKEPAWTDGMAMADAFFKGFYGKS